MNPWMSNKEIELLSKYMNIANIYFEFGSGGSTNFAINTKNIKKIYSIDTDKKWLDKFNHKKLYKKYIDIGPVKSFGNPKNESKKKNWMLYSDSISDIVETPDMVLIDGRFRVACGLKTWLKSNNNTNILIHDFTNREHYHILLNFYEIKESEDTLVVMNKKETNIDINEIYENYKNDVK